MKPRDEFRAWLDCADLDNTGRERTAAARRRLEAFPPVAAFLQAVEGLGEDECGTIGTAIEKLFADTDWVTMLTRDWIGEAGKDCFFVPPFRPASGAFHESALLLELPGVTISLCAIDSARLRACKRQRQEKGSVFFSGSRAWLKFLEPGGLRMSFWEKHGRSDTNPDAGTQCLRLGDKEIAQAELLSIDLAQRSFVFDHADSLVLFLYGELRVGGAELAREYEADSGQCVGRSSGSEAWSRVQLMASFLSRFGVPSAPAVFNRVIAEAPFYVRWDVMREWVSLDPVSALPRLTEMARNDPHHEIRFAACQTLDLLRRLSGPKSPSVCQSS
ncbi:hypothetical protein [Parasphingopyxis lamellibrachiae]|uniref:HEAT repeat protein n=1 Tax=Parasphingopyxis lamellibrachiae TaxID=680125 RepID=A0A3D9FEN4_9SPHN|nr:hypothetical protein [Parasphingopyxis lamellibrachiae]RED16280.1 hypothetical protein DFR46_1302 [Parasphingopyxis lamellibrachiae]